MAMYSAIILLALLGTQEARIEELHKSKERVRVYGPMSISPDGSRLLSMGLKRGSVIDIHRLPDLAFEKEFQFGFDRVGFSALVSKDEAIVTVQSRTPLQWKIFRLDLVKGEKEMVAAGDDEYVLDVWPERKAVVLAKDHDPKPQIRIFHVPDKKVAVVDLDARFGLPICFSPDRTRMAAVNGKGTRIFDLKSGRTVSELPISHRPDRGSVFTPDNKCLVTIPTDWEGDVLVWGIKAKRVVRRISIRATPEGLAVSPDGSMVAVHVLRLLMFFDLETGFPIRGPIPIQDSAEFLSFHPNGRMFITGNQDGYIRVYPMPTRK